MSLKQLWAFYNNEEAVESARRLEAAGIGSRLSHRDKGLFGDPSESDLVWLSVDESDYQRATEILGVSVSNESTPAGGTYHYQSVPPAVDQEPAPTGAPWACQCGEQLEAQFVSCWNCGTNRPDRQ